MEISQNLSVRDIFCEDHGLQGNAIELAKAAPSEVILEIAAMLKMLAPTDYSDIRKLSPNYFDMRKLPKEIKILHGKAELSLADAFGQIEFVEIATALREVLKNKDIEFKFFRSPTSIRHVTVDHSAPPIADIPLTKGIAAVWRGAASVVGRIKSGALRPFFTRRHGQEATHGAD